MGLEVVETEDRSWDGLAFTVYLDEPPKQANMERLRQLIEAWYMVGLHGGFKGCFHYMSNISFDENLVEWWVDMGSSSTQALEVLIACLETFGQVYDVPVKKLVLGFEVVE